MFVTHTLQEYHFNLNEYPIILVKKNDASDIKIFVTTWLVTHFEIGSTWQPRLHRRPHLPHLSHRPHTRLYPCGSFLIYTFLIIIKLFQGRPP